MKQLTLATAGFERYAKRTRRATFLAEMERVVPWPALCALIEPFYPKPGNGRPPIGVERMLRLYFLQHWFNLSDPAVEKALYDSQAMRRFVDIDLGREPVPDKTTVRGRRALSAGPMVRIRLSPAESRLRTRLTSHLHVFDPSELSVPPTVNAVGARLPRKRPGGSAVGLASRSSIMLPSPRALRGAEPFGPQR
jgi:hypothetical protein